MLHFLNMRSKESIHLEIPVLIGYVKGVYYIC